MALLTIKPSRGTVAFFVLLVAGLLIHYGWTRRETQLFVRDAPPAHSTRRLLRCVLGRDAQRLLGPRPADRAAAAWEAKITERLRQLVAQEYSGAWPARCVPIAERLEHRLDAMPETRRAWSPAREVARMLRDAAARGRLVALQHVEDGTLGAQLAQLAFEVSVLSDGAEEAWTSDLPPEASDMTAAPAALRAPVPLPPHADYPTLVLPDLVLYQSVLDRRLHAVTFDRNDRVASDTDVGRGAPVRGARRDGAALVASDAGDALFLPTGEPARLVPLPEPLRRGEEALGEWQLAYTPGYLWLLTEHRGELRVRRTPREGRARWSEVLATVGVEDAMLGGVITPDTALGEVVNVAALRRGANTAWLERWPVGPVTDAGGAAATAPSSQPPAPRAQDTAERPRRGRNGASTNTNTAAAAPIDRTVLNEWPAFGPHVTSCAAGGSRYLLVVSADQVSVVALREGAAVPARLELPLSAELGTPSGGRAELTCDEHRALLFIDLSNRAGTLALLDFEGGGHVAVLNPPHFGDNAQVVGAALTASHGVVALVDNRRTLRAYRCPNPRAARAAEWDGGALVALHRPAPANARPDTAWGAGEEPMSMQVGAVASHGDQVALLVEQRVGARFCFGRLASRDGGRTWR